MSEVRQLNVGEHRIDKRIARPRRVNPYHKTHPQHYHYEPDEADLIPTPQRSDVTTESVVPTSAPVAQAASPARIPIHRAPETAYSERKRGDAPERTLHSPSPRRYVSPGTPIHSVSHSHNIAHAEPEAPPVGGRALLIAQAVLFVVAAIGMVGFLGVEQQVSIQGEEVITTTHFSWKQVAHNAATLQAALFAHVGGWKF